MATIFGDVQYSQNGTFTNSVHEPWTLAQFWPLPLGPPPYILYGTPRYDGDPKRTQNGANFQVENGLGDVLFAAATPPQLDEVRKYQISCNIEGRKNMGDYIWVTR